MWKVERAYSSSRQFEGLIFVTLSKNQTFIAFTIVASLFIVFQLRTVVGIPSFGR